MLAVSPFFGFCVDYHRESRGLADGQKQLQFGLKALASGLAALAFCRLALSGGVLKVVLGYAGALICLYICFRLIVVLLNEPAVVHRKSFVSFLFAFAVMCAFAAMHGSYSARMREAQWFKEHLNEMALNICERIPLPRAVSAQRS